MATIPRLPPAAVALTVAVIALAVYAITLAPTVTLVDSGELIVAARNLGVAHPPGFPLYVLLAHAATWVPLGNLAQRVNAASAVFAALAAAVTSLALREMVLGLPLSSFRPEQRRPRKAAAPAAAPTALWAGPGVLIATGLVLAFSRTPWAYATVAEVYTLNTLLVATALALALRWRRTGRPARGLLAVAVAFALGLGVHHATVALTLPALGVLILSARPKRSQLLAPALACLAVVGLLYATLPVLASREPVLSWGDPTSLQRLFWHVTGRQYQAFVSFSLGGAAREAEASVARLLGESGMPPLVPMLAAWGCVVLWRRDRVAFTAITALVAVNLAVTSLYTIAEDKDAYQLPALLGVVLATGMALADLVARLKAASPAARHAATLLTALPLLPLLANFGARDRSSFFVASDYADNALKAVPANGLVLTSDWQVYSPLLYVQEAEGRRRDVVAVDVTLLRRSWYLSYLQRRHPRLMGRIRAPLSEFAEELRAWERDPLPYDRDPELNRRINARFQGMMTALVAAQLEGGGRAYATHEVVVPQGSPDPVLAGLLFQRWTLRPRGILFELSPDKGFTPLEPLQLETRGLARGPIEIDEVVTTKVRPAYLVMLVNRGRYLAAAKDAQGARQAFERALALDPELPLAREGLAALPAS